MSLNVVVGRAAHEDVPPNGLSFWRWAVASILFLPFALPRLREQWRDLIAHWRTILFLTVVMIPLGNNLLYVGLQETTALNAALIAVARPAIILVIVWLVFRGPVTRYQWIGISVAVIGVTTVVTRGNPGVLGGLSINSGDLWVIAATCGIATYQANVSRVPHEVHPVVLLQAIMALGALIMLPFYLVETGFGRPVEPTWPAIGAILFVAIFPSICAVYLINAGIAAVGPARMGVFNYLQPLFTSMIAIPILGEQPHWYHPVAFALIAGGIVIASRRRNPRP